MTQPLRFVVHVDSEFHASNSDGEPLLAEARGAAALANALCALGHDVLLQEAPLSSAPDGRWILSFNADPEAALAGCGGKRDSIEWRLIPIDEGRIQSGELMDALRIPFVVTSRSFRNWRSTPTFALQVFGRTTLATTLHIAFNQSDVRVDRVQFDVTGMPLPEGIARCCVALGAVSEQAALRSQR